MTKCSICPFQEEIKRSKSWHPTPNSWAGQPSFKFTRFLLLRQCLCKCHQRTNFPVQKLRITHVRLLKPRLRMRNRRDYLCGIKGGCMWQLEWPTRSSQEGDQTWGRRKDVGPLKLDLPHYSCGVFNKVKDGKQSKKWAGTSHFTALLLGAKWQG